MENIDPRDPSGGYRFPGNPGAARLHDSPGGAPCGGTGGETARGGDGLRSRGDAGHRADACGPLRAAARAEPHPERRPSPAEGERPPGRAGERTAEDRNRGGRSSRTAWPSHGGRPPAPGSRPTTTTGSRWVSPSWGWPCRGWKSRGGLRREVLSRLLGGLGRLYQNGRVPSAGEAIRMNKISPRRITGRGHQGKDGTT